MSLIIQHKSFRLSFVVKAVLCGLIASGLLIALDIFVFHLASDPKESAPLVTDTEAFMQYLQEALLASGAHGVQLHLKEAYRDAPYGDQHMSFHYFGEVLYQQEGTEAFPLCTDWYGYGCYHGFMLAAIDAEGYDVVESLDAACREKHGYSLETETCQHGIGHGLLESSGRNPFEAIKVCDTVADVFPKLGCASGVFMEYFNPTQSDTRGKVSLVPAFDAEHPFDVCDAFEGLRQVTCFFEIQSWWQNTGHLTALEVERLCSFVSATEAREFCFIGYGNLMGPYVERGLPYCREFVDDEHEALCRAGLLWAAEHHYDATYPEAACADLEATQRDTCFEKGRFTCEVEGRCELRP